MRIKLLAALLLISAISSNVFAATVKSGTGPLSGTYNFITSGFCEVDSAASYPGGYPTSYNSMVVGQHIYTPDSSHTGASNAAAFSSWVSYAMGLVSVMTNPTTLLTSTNDPTSVTLPIAKLTETPIEWGTISKIKSKLTFTGPASSTPEAKIGGGIHYFFITSFTYSNPSNSNQVKTGYAHYSFGMGDTTWNRAVLYFDPATGVANNAVALGASTTQINAGGTIFTFNCADSGNLAK